MNSIKFDNGEKDELDLSVATIQSEFGVYKGTHSDVKRAFEINHDNNPIFEKSPVKIPVYLPLAAATSSNMN